MHVFHRGGGGYILFLEQPIMDFICKYKGQQLCVTGMGMTNAEQITIVNDSSSLPGRSHQPEPKIHQAGKFLLVRAQTAASAGNRTRTQDLLCTYSCYVPNANGIIHCAWTTIVCNTFYIGTYFFQLHPEQHNIPILYFDHCPLLMMTTMLIDSPR